MRQLLISVAGLELTDWVWSLLVFRKKDVSMAAATNDFRNGLEEDVLVLEAFAGDRHLGEVGLGLPYQ